MGSVGDLVRAEFAADPWVKQGEAELSTLTKLQTLAVLNLHGMLDRYQHLLPKTTLVPYLVASSGLAVNVRPARTPGVGVAILTVGLLDLFGALAARMTVIAMRQKGLPFLVPTATRQRFPAFPAGSLGAFDLPNDKQGATGLTTPAINALLVGLEDDGALAFIEIYCAALEFMVLHEASHVALRHREALQAHQGIEALKAGFDKAGLMNWEDTPTGARFTRDTAIRRCLEHQADATALRLMTRVAPTRPQLPRQLAMHWARPVFASPSSRRFLALVGAGIAFAAVTLMEARVVDGKLGGSASALDHPLPLYRLKIAAQLLCSDLASPLRRLVRWPGMLFGDYSNLIMTAEWVTMIAATAILYPDPEAEFARPGKNWSQWRRVAVLEHDQEPFMWNGFERDMERARDLVTRVRGTWSRS